VKGTTGVPIRLKYEKIGKIRWIGHRDVARAMERAFRVVQLPLAFTEGFSPHPKVSFGLALSTGHESEAEYLDLVLAEDVDVDQIPAVISDALPAGMAVVGAQRLVDRAPALQEAVTSVAWRVEIAPGAGTRDQIAAGLAAPTLETMRHRKGRDILEDVRPVIRSIDVHDDTTVDMELHTQPRSAKPGEVLAAIGGITEVRALRTHQWIERDGARLEPLDADTITVGFASADGGVAAAAGSDSSRPYAPEGAYVTREGIDVRSGTSRGWDEREERDGRDERRGVGRAAAGDGRDRV
jgi:radical SAM-linked protein